VIWLMIIPCIHHKDCLLWRLFLFLLRFLTLIVCYIAHDTFSVRISCPFRKRHAPPTNQCIWSDDDDDDGDDDDDDDDGDFVELLLRALFITFGAQGQGEQEP
jgi:hypothetical protein